jgi:hypothetical protein
VPGVGHFLVRDAWATYADELRVLAHRAGEQPQINGPAHP